MILYILAEHNFKVLINVILLFQKMNEAIVLDLQDKSAHISSLNKTPASIIQEYAAKNRLVPQYDLIYNGISQSKVSFKYSLTLDGYVTVGDGSSKKEAKHVAAFKLLNEMIKDKPELLRTDFKQWDFEKHVVSPFDNTIKENAVGKLNDICANNKLALPEFKLVREEGQAHAKLFTMSCHVSKMIEVATHKTKKQAKHLVADQMVKRLLSMDKSLALDNEAHVPDSIKVLEQVEMIKSECVIKKNAPMDEDLSNFHLLFKQTEWVNSESLIDIIKQYNCDGTLDIVDPYTVLKDIAQTCDMVLVEKLMDKESLINKNTNFCIICIENVYPPIYGIGIDDNIEIAKDIASSEVLKNMCILSK